MITALGWIACAALAGALVAGLVWLARSAPALYRLWKGGPR